MSSITRLLHRCLEVRRTLGYKLLVEGRMLAQFTAYLDENGHEYIATVTALAWATAPRAAAGCWWAARLSAVRAFARFAIAFDPRTEIPSTKLLARDAHDRLVPRIFTDHEISALIEAARALANPLRAAGISTLIGLMAATGMRSGEVMGLDRADVDLPAALITVHGTKFGKHRLVPVHPSTALCSEQVFLAPPEQVLLAPGVGRMGGLRSSDYVSEQLLLTPAAVQVNFSVGRVVMRCLGEDGLVGR